ncbi:hypothetical protein RchiOBHm_Chr4g0408391 [Rosa chinensis]|uniref:Secreted protein n=1 Tax=Rosa chinensis TaxID=74649 RepID=A0A2P6QUU4_ROSCH|nr:hypothetical protein RchiOBHm_Chr4g0408391 [Rosa chinensis]
MSLSLFLSLSLSLTPPSLFDLFSLSPPSSRISLNSGSTTLVTQTATASLSLSLTLNPGLLRTRPPANQRAMVLSLSL